MRAKWTKIRKSDLKAFLLLFPFVEIQAFNIGRLYDIAIVLAGIYIILLYIKRQLKFQYKYIPLLLYAGWLTLSCFLNRINIIPGLFYGLKLFAFTQVVEYYVQNKDITFLLAIRKYFTFCIVITTFFQYVNQGFWGQNELSLNYNNFSFGDNLLGYYYISFISACLVLDRLQHKRISNYTWTMIMVSILSLIRAWSAKSIIGIILVVIYVIFIYRYKIAKLFTPIFAIATYVAAELGLVFFNITERFSVVRNFIENALQKDVTLTGRTYLWVSTLNNVKNSPIFGHGVTFGGAMYINSTLAGRAGHSSHNLILEILLQTGVVGLVLWSSFIFLSIYKRKRNIDEDPSSYYMLLFFAYVILIMQMSSGSIYLSFCYLPVILCANTYEIFSENRRSDDK